MTGHMSVIEKRTGYSAGSFRATPKQSVVAMQTIAHWLNALGLGQYAQRFAENYIDASVVRDLTDQDLEKIGIPLGHRKKLLRAIRELADTSPAAPPTATASNSAPQSAAQNPCGPPAWQSP